MHRARKHLRNITECAAASETAPEDNLCFIETSDIVSVGRRRLPALNFPHSLSSPFCLVLLLLVHLFLQILCWQCAPPEALLRLYNHRNHLHLHRSGFNSKCCWVFFFFRWSFSSVCLMIAQISILTYRSSMLPTSKRERFRFPISFLSVGMKTGGSCRQLLLKAMEEDNRLYRK